MAARRGDSWVYRAFTSRTRLSPPLLASESSSGGSRAGDGSRPRPSTARTARPIASSAGRARRRITQEGSALEAREKAHELASDAERQARERLQEIVGLEQALADKTRALADRLAASDRHEQDLRGREKVIRQQEQSAAKPAGAPSSCSPSGSASCSASRP